MQWYWWLLIAAAVVLLGFIKIKVGGAFLKSMREKRERQALEDED